MNLPKIFYLLKNKMILNFVIFEATKEVGKHIFSLPSFGAVVGSWILIRDPGSGMD
jgi:hypothetical protein